MTENNFNQSSLQPILSDFNTRIRDMDERSRLIRERVLVLGKNMITSRNELEEEIKNVKEENRIMKQEMEKIKKISSTLLNEYQKFVKKDEMYLIERMLKDFQPLEFMRKKDVEELIEEKNSLSKQIKTKDTIL